MTDSEKDLAGGSRSCATEGGVVVADAQERVPPVTRKLIAAGFAYPEAYADIPGECLFSAKELPVGKQIRFTVTPRDCFGLAGKPLVKNIQL